MASPATTINADLTARRCDVTQAQRLAENGGIAFMGDTKGGAIRHSGRTGAENGCKRRSIANGRPNTRRLQPWVNGIDVTRRHPTRGSSILAGP